MKTATTAIKAPRAGLVAGSAALLVFGALGFGGIAHARDNVSFSVGIGLPLVGVSSAYPVYTQPVYEQPVYVQPQSIYVQPQPVYVQPAPVYYQNVPVYYGRPHRHGHHRGGYYVLAPRPGYGHGYDGQRYAPVYYQR